MKKLKTLFSILIISLFLQVQSASAETHEKITIAQFGQAKFLLYLPLYIALEEGLFAKRGLDVNLKFAGNDDQIFAAVMSGSADFGMGDPVFTAISKEKGGPGKVVAMMITKLGLSGYTNKSNIGQITDLKQLNGLKISSFPEPSTTFTLLSQLKRNGAPELQIVQAAFGAQLATLESGKVDIAVDLEPTVSIAEDKGYKVIFDFEKFTEPQAITGITTTEEVINNKPITVQKVVDALQEAMTLLHTDKETSIQTAKKIFPDLKYDVIKAAVDRMLERNMYPQSIVIDDAYWQRTLQSRIDSGDLKKPQTTDAAVDNTFAMRAQQDKK
jgi:NitT/TauT family transport system substrate-binding protein